MKRCSNCEYFNTSIKYKDKCLCRVKGVGYVSKDQYCNKFVKKKAEQLKLI